MEVVADSAAEVKEGNKDDEEGAGKDESGQEVKKMEETEGEEQKKEQANVSD